MTEKRLIRVGHSPDADDAFMFHALANDKFDTRGYRFEHELVDIETLNRRAFHGELELTAVSIHAYAYLNDVYALCSCGASMGDKYGPRIVAREPMDKAALAKTTIAVPGELTTAFLALRLYLDSEFEYKVVPFDKILDVVAAGEYEGVAIGAGLVIHEGQLTYGEQGLQLLQDLGQWWDEETGLPLPLGANAIRKDLGGQVIEDVALLLKRSIEYALANRDEALDYALSFARGLERDTADEFVGMYVNHWTVDFGQRGRQAVAELLRRGYEAGAIPKRVVPEFV